MAEAVTVPVVLGTGSNDTAPRRRADGRAEATGAAGVLVVTPYYNRPSQAGIEAHFRAMAEATDAAGDALRHRHADRPGASRPTTCSTPGARRAEHRRREGRQRRPRPRPPAWSPRRRPASSSTAATDALNLPLLAVGAVGIIGVATHWAGARDEGDGHRLQEGRRRRAPAQSTPACSTAGRSRAATLNPNPIPTKAMLRTMGLPAGPMPSADGPLPRRPRGPSPRGAERASMASPVRITFLGGLGEIGRNCAAFELDGKILLLDCGLMFPEAEHLGIDLVLPDFTWLRENADRVIGCILTHGHEDHAGGLSYLLRDLSFPLYGSALTLGFARNRIDEAGLAGRTDVRGRRTTASAG